MAKVTLTRVTGFSDEPKLPWQAEDAVSVIRQFHRGVVRPGSSIGPQSVLSVGRTIGHNDGNALLDGIKILADMGHVELNEDESNITVTEQGYEALFR